MNTMLRLHFSTSRFFDGLLIGGPRPGVWCIQSCGGDTGKASRVAMLIPFGKDGEGLGVKALSFKGNMMQP